jgi:hypothetical protein
MNLVTSKYHTKKHNVLYKTLISLLLSLSICACQNTQDSENNQNSESNDNGSQDIVVANPVNFGDYYLKLKTLSASELQKEIALQQMKKQDGSIEAGVYLILLYSLPNSGIHNVYSAKSQLNEQLKTYHNYPLTTADQAFIRLLKDQLNQQLFLFQKLINQELAYDAQVSKHRISEKKQLNQIAALELTVTQLTKQITQLKKIEQTISEHGQ